MSNLRVYRILVESWPTPDGEPWARFYGDGAASPNHEMPDWLTPFLDSGFRAWDRHLWSKTPEARVAKRLKVDDRFPDGDRVVGVLMPKPKRKNYLSASGVSELAADMRAFGAIVRVERSRAVDW